MRFRVLGRTGLKVSELSLGGCFLAGKHSDFEAARGAVHRAIELGVNYVDTAPGYGNSEEVLGRALDGVRAPLILSTKLGGRPQPFEPKSKDCLRRSIEESLRLLGRDVIDILFIHEPDRWGQYDWWSDDERFEGPVVEFMDDLKQKGVIRFTGLGGTTAYEMARIIRTGRFDVVLTAFNYSLLWREATHAVIPAARAQGMGIVIGSPLQQGALARRYDDEARHGAPWLSMPRREQYLALYRLLDDLSMPIHELAMRFVISNPDISCVLSGSRSKEEVEQNMAAAARGPLPGDVMARLDQIAAMVPFRPFEEPFGLPFGGRKRAPVGRAGR